MLLRLQFLKLNENNSAFNDLIEVRMKNTQTRCLEKYEGQGDFSLAVNGATPTCLKATPGTSTWTAFSHLFVSK